LLLCTVAQPDLPFSYCGNSLPWRRGSLPRVVLSSASSLDRSQSSCKTTSTSSLPRDCGCIILAQAPIHSLSDSMSFFSLYSCAGLIARILL
jgi:hypothetical protein